jgi:hypothetical protein
MQFDFKTVLPEENITKEFIFSKVRQEDIAELCLGTKPVFTRHMFSPLRKEKSPSFSLKVTPSNDIIFRDWGSNENGDIIKLTCLVFGCSYTKALRLIYEKLIKGNAIPTNDVRLELQSRSSDPVVKHQNLIHIKTQNFTGTDFKYWGQYGIDLKTLQAFKVYSAKHVWLKKYDYFQDKYKGWKLIKTYQKTNPTYAYEFTRNNHLAYKIYSPYGGNYKWMFNGDESDIQGYDMLPHLGESLVLTKSLKDVMCLYKMGIPAISLQGEHNRLSHELFNKLTKRFEQIIVFYDNDEVGLKTAEAIASEFNLPSIVIPESKNS